MSNTNVENSLVESELQFEGYRVNKLSYEPLVDLDALGEGVPVGFTLDREIKVDKEGKRVEVCLVLRVGPQPELPEVPFAIEVSITGNFTYAGDIPLTANAVSILFPFLRSVTAMLTTLANISPFYLPIINIGASEDAAKK